MIEINKEQIESAAREIEDIIKHLESVRDNVKRNNGYYLGIENAINHLRGFVYDISKGYY